MQDILVVCHREDGSICNMYQIHGDRHNWKHCFPLIRDNEPDMVDFNIYRVDRYK